MRLDDLNNQANNPDVEVRTHQQCMADAAAELQLNGHHATASPGTPPLIHIVMSKHVAEDALTRTTDPDGVTNEATTPTSTRTGSPSTPTRHRPTMRTRRRHTHPPTHRPVAVLGCHVPSNGDGPRLRDPRPRPNSTRLPPTIETSPHRHEQAGSCEHPGCDAPVTWLQADHIFPMVKRWTRPRSRTAKSSATPTTR